MGSLPTSAGSSRAPRHALATASFALGVASMTLLGAVTGLPAIIVGAIARKEIDRSGGAATGSSMAAAGIVSGLFGTGLSLVLGLMLASELAAPPRPAQALHTARFHTQVAEAPRAYGSLVVAELDDKLPLRSQLAMATRSAEANGRVVLLQTCTHASRTCAEITDAFTDARMQLALADVVILRVDVEDFPRDLRAMRISTERAPWFYKLDASGNPIDAVNADEWDANVPENIVSVLGPFVRGSLRNRRIAAPVPTSL